MLAADPSPDSGGIVGFVTGLMEKLGGPGAGLAVALENLFPPIPSEVILPLAGFTASQGNLSLASAIIWTTIGSVVGALALYYVGALLGRDRVRAIAAKLPLVKLADVDRTEAWFLRHGVQAVFFGRMIPVFRSLISIPAGVERMRVTTFLLYTALGSLIWNTVFVMAGYLLGENWHVVEGYVGILQNVVIVVCVLAVGWFVTTRLLRARRARLSPDQVDEADLPQARPAPDAYAGYPAPDGYQGQATDPVARARASRGTLYGTPRRPTDQW
ncbi:DedA family protein [Micromonospora sp. NBC_01796]|uniref:DedA family protein n=1 Tax=Micromonospora sp. NBC_01796 TaxID=2975987 RepID=UPI002DDB0575|nr:DedA family protein [Micromonospora sp. NBC_01796]WSA89910.1 DedA family protein [Micromonospora sp. NBC_01796]